jgi:cysteinyl-tRNA synthetase, unknown class
MKYLACTLSTFLLLSCGSSDGDSPPEDDNYKQRMRDFVVSISNYSKAIRPQFLIVPQNGIELVSSDGEDVTNPDERYLAAIDANGQEDLHYGYDEDDQATPAGTVSYLKGFLEVSRQAGKTILVTDYCSTRSKVDQSYQQNGASAYIGFAADHRELDNVPAYPSIVDENSDQVTSISQVRNFLYLINPENFSSKQEFIDLIRSTNYDLLIVDFFFHDGSAFTAEEVELLKGKANGGRRLVISYLSIGEAEDYRYYWNASWNSNPPTWLDQVNPDWPGNYKVKYWDPEWQKIIFGDSESYLGRILNTGFDGAYLDIIDAFEYYE